MQLGYRRPYDWDRLLTFFAGRATPGVEAVENGCYRRSVLIDRSPRILTIRHDAKARAILVSFDGSRANVSQTVAQKSRTLFDLDAPIRTITAVLGKDRIAGRFLKQHPGVRVPGAWDGFELTVRAILGQQISVKAATTIAGRIASRYGQALEPGERSGSISRLFPTPEKLARARFNGMGLVQSRINTIRAVARAVVDGDLRFDGAQDNDELRKTLMSIRGIGDWTAQYVAMRALREPDAFPVSDLGLLSAVRKGERLLPSELAQLAEQWRPWRAYAAMLLWSAEMRGG